MLSGLVQHIESESCGLMPFSTIQKLLDLILQIGDVAECLSQLLPRDDLHLLHLIAQQDSRRGQHHQLYFDAPDPFSIRSTCRVFF